MTTVELEKLSDAELTELMKSRRIQELGALKDEDIQKRLKEKRLDALKTLDPAQFSDPDFSNFRFLGIVLILSPILAIIAAAIFTAQSFLVSIIIFFAIACICLIMLLIMSLRTRGFVRVGMHTIDGKFIDLYAKPDPRGILKLRNYGAYIIDHTCGKPSYFSFPYGIGHGSGMYYEYYQGNPFPLKPNEDTLIPERDALTLFSLADSQLASKIHDASKESNKKRSLKDAIGAVAIVLMICSVALSGYTMFTEGKEIKTMKEQLQYNNYRIEQINLTLVKPTGTGFVPPPNLNIGG